MKPALTPNETGRRIGERIATHALAALPPALVLGAAGLFWAGICATWGSGTGGSVAPAAVGFALAIVIDSGP